MRLNATNLSTQQYDLCTKSSVNSYTVNTGKCRVWDANPYKASRLNLIRVSNYELYVPKPARRSR